ncbi:YlxR family protein [Ureibacillus sp. FSL K6-8385]|uniref:YlxR family protein n=1 Tax=Ureibacillus terrenus TaxID=118246 RepID=A0A540V4H8_9BACL|nr:YlxR family protein [Ureibacillus terrenus]MED3660439.1 YlxR family protein [Ureibacillus terrenus]TQE91657.1 YlxR family protein [Ureibacillus terrenus]
MPTKRKVPLRRCVVTGESFPKKELLRIVRTKEGEVFVDPTGKKSGRGAYVSKSEEVVEKARKSKVLERHLDVKIPDEIYDELIRLIRREQLLKNE